MSMIRNMMNFASSLPVREDKRILTLPPNSTLDESRIKVDYSITERYNKGWVRDLSTIWEAVVHHTDGEGTFAGLKNWMLTETDKKRVGNWKKGIALFHFVIERNGTIYKTSPIARWLYHSCCGQYDKHTVGIELIQKVKEFTPAQYASLNWLLFEYLPYHCKNYHRVVSHDYNFLKYSNGYKGCPGKMFDPVRFDTMLHLQAEPKRTCLPAASSVFAYEIVR